MTGHPRGKGHGDIYDNDSIVINYAPGFDKSQITKIDVYRNGIRLRFLTDTFDVLTNAQMKTFDGNPAEHSPASNHTDHAIMGYEYKFEINTADHMWILTKTVKSGFRWHPKELWAEIDGAWTESLAELDYDDMVDFFAQLRKDVFTGISFDVAYYMNSPYDNEVFGQHGVDKTITSWNITTPTAGELEELLKAITEAGLSAYVRGNIYISKKYQDKHGFSWSSQIDPANPKKFFDSYTQLWLNLVSTLDKYSVKLISPFTEMEGIEKYPNLVKRMYSILSRDLTGELGFEEATNLMLLGISPMQQGRTFEQMARTFTFWNWTDSKGMPMRIEYSCWTPPIENQRDQRVSVMASNFISFWSPAVEYYRSTYPDDPQMFGEIGGYNADGVGLGPSYWEIPNKRFDHQEVADIWYAYLKGSRGLGINSINVWTIGLGDLWANDVAGDFFVNIGLRQPESPAYRIIKAIIGAN